MRRRRRVMTFNAEKKPSLARHKEITETRETTTGAELPREPIADRSSSQ